MIQTFNNRTEKVGKALKNNIRKDSKLQVAAGNFSIYGFNALKNELKGKAIARECKKWIEQKVSFKTNVGSKYI